MDGIGDTLLQVFFVRCCGKSMSGTEEVKEQTEVVMEDVDKSSPTAQQEVVLKSCSILGIF